jgi:hypothetical protein
MQTNQYHMATKSLRRATEAVLLLAVIAGCANMQPAQPLVQVPDKLQAGPDESLALIASAKGVQIYECRAKKVQSGEYEWAFVAPEAELFGANGNKIGKHYAGPHWEANDGSRIVGAVKANSPAPAADAIPWLLLTAKSTGPAGSFSNITSVQRVSTVGGLAPKTGCSQAAVGAPARINYTADYYFFTKK